MSSKILLKLFMAVILLWNIVSKVEAKQKYSTFTKDLIFIAFDFPKPTIEKIGKYHQIKMEGLSTLGDGGLPELPVMTAKILIPYNMKIVSAKVFKGHKVTLEDSFFIKPAQRVYPISYKGRIEPTLLNESIYSSYLPFPKTIYSDISIQDKKGYQILLVNLHPVEYIPKTGIISYYEDIGIKIKVGPPVRAISNQQQFLRGREADKKDVLRIVDNPEVMETYPVGKKGSQIQPLEGAPLQPLLPSASYDYVIITNNALKNSATTPNFQTLIQHKQSRGIKATITTTEFIYANYSGTDNQTKIRNFIKDAYTTWGIDYVLLGGDGDGANVGGESGNNIIPSRGFYDIVNESFPGDEREDNNIPADMYYACLDGTFDGDGDGVYGETTDSPDLYAEVYVGRAPVDSETELANFVRKTIAYETSNYDKKALMVGENLDVIPTWGGNYKDEIKNGASSNGYTTVGFSPDWSVDTLYDRDDTNHDWNVSTLIAKINAGLQAVNHLGHSNNTYNMKMIEEDWWGNDVSNLTNTMYFLGYSQGCYPGAFDNRDSSGSYIIYDSIVEHFVTGSHGAFAYVANSRYGWYSPGSTNGPSQYFDRQFWDAIFGEGITNLGRVNQDSKEDNAGYINSRDAIRWCYYNLNLFGCPETPFLLPATSRGEISLDKSSYVPGDIIKITIADTDLNSGLTTIQQYTNIATLSTTGGDLETNILMKETDSNTSVFKGTISIAYASPTPQNGVIEIISSGEIVTATYYDANDGTGNPAIVTVTATVSYSLSISVERMDSYYTNDEDLDIPDGVWEGVVSHITVPTSMIVETVDVFVDITHPESAEIGIALISPQGDSYTLHDIFTTSGAFIPQTYTTRSVFRDENAEGTWLLNVGDVLSDNIGTLNLWRMKIKTNNILGFGQIGLGQIIQSSSPARFKVTNNGNIPEDFTLKLTNPPSWSAGDTAGNEVYVLKGLFVDSSDSPTSGYFGADDVITTNPQTASATKFGDSAMSANGTSVPANDSRYLWFQFQAPTATAVTSEQTITVTIGAQPP